MKHYKKIQNYGQLLAVLMLLVFSVQASNAAVPIATDSRIKMFVYNENEVFPVMVHFGYQSNIEFAKGETIQTLSIGDPYAWSVTPVGRRLFVKSLEASTHTNMTVITNERTYQFDLTSRKIEPGELDDGLMYVMRFYYPEEHIDEKRYAPPAPMSNVSVVAPSPRMGVIPPAPPSTVNPNRGMGGFSAHENYRYTLTGPDTIAPLRVFDDGRETYMQFPTERIPHISRMSSDGREYPVTVRREGKYTIMNAVAEKFYIRQDDLLVCVFNEGYLGGR